MAASLDLSRFALDVRTAVRNLARNGTRSSLALGAIAFGVAALILSGGFVRDLIFQLGEALIHSQSGHIQIARAGYFDAGARSPGKYLVSAQQADPARFSDVMHVSETVRRLGFSALLSNGRSSFPVVGEGTEAEREAKLGTALAILQGRTLSAADRHAALVGAGLARAMDLKPGSFVSLIAPTVDEAINTVEIEVVGVFQSFSKDFDDRAIKIPLQTAQELLNSESANVVVVLLDRTAHTGAAAQALSQRIRGSGLELRTWETLNDFYWKAVALYERQFGVLRLIVLVMVALAVMGAINMAVLERVGEFGTMRALGSRSGQVLRLVVMESALMGLLGAALGVALGVASAWLISRIGIPMPPPPNSNLEFIASIRLAPSMVAEAFAVGLSATVLASLVPALRVSRVPIVDALRRMS